MFSEIFQLSILFFVIIDPLMSMGIFLSATHKLKTIEKRKIAFTALSVAVILSAIFLIFGDNVLNVMHISLKDFQIAGGIILGLLGIQMALGHSLKESDKFSHTNAKAIAAIIGTPLLTGPAAITTIIISVSTYGILITAISLAIVFLITLFLFYFSETITKLLGNNTIQVITTILGMLTLAYGIIYIKAGLL